MTVSVVVVLTPPSDAPTMVVPTPTEVASPSVPPEFDTVATDGSVDDQVTSVVRSCVELSE